MKELTKAIGTQPRTGFYQRVFTDKLRFDPVTKKKNAPVKVGQPPHDFALRIAGESGLSHVTMANRGTRGKAEVAARPLPPTSPGSPLTVEESIASRTGIRTINGEALPTPVRAELSSGQIELEETFEHWNDEFPRYQAGPHEQVDPLGAATAISTRRGLNILPAQTMADPRPALGRPSGIPGNQLEPAEMTQLGMVVNAGKDTEDQCELINAYYAKRGQILLTRKETPKEALLRWQHELSPKSFHSAIFSHMGSHANVTAYDVAIGGGKACSHPLFYAYLCNVADWRLKKFKGQTRERASIPLWSEFKTKFACYWNAEPKWRKELIEGNSDYYSTGVLPTCIPGLKAGLPSEVVSELVRS